MNGSKKAQIHISLARTSNSTESRMSFSWKIVFSFYVWTALALAVASNQTFDTACYGSSLPSLSPANDTRSVPWGAPGVKTNGTTCCNSMAEVREHLITIDDKILKLLGKRAAYAREASRFKSNQTLLLNQTVKNIISERALNASKVHHIPETIAVEVYNKVMETTLAFKQCSYDSYRSGK